MNQTLKGISLPVVSTTKFESLSRTALRITLKSYSALILSIHFYSRARAEHSVQFERRSNYLIMTASVVTSINLFISLMASVTPTFFAARRPRLDVCSECLCDATSFFSTGSQNKDFVCITAHCESYGRNCAQQITGNLA